MSCSAHENLRAVELHLEELGGRLITDEEIDGYDEVHAALVWKSEQLRWERLLRLTAEQQRPVPAHYTPGRNVSRSGDDR